MHHSELAREFKSIINNLSNAVGSVQVYNKAPTMNCVSQLEQATLPDDTSSQYCLTLR